MISESQTYMKNRRTKIILLCLTSLQVLITLILLPLIIIQSKSAWYLPSLTLAFQLILVYAIFKPWKCLLKLFLVFTLIGIAIWSILLLLLFLSIFISDAWSEGLPTVLIHISVLCLLLIYNIFYYHFLKKYIEEISVILANESNSC